MYIYTCEKGKKIYTSMATFIEIDHRAKCKAKTVEPLGGNRKQSR